MTARYLDSKHALIEVAAFRVAHFDATIRKVLAPTVDQNCFTNTRTAPDVPETFVCLLRSTPSITNRNTSAVRFNA